MQPINPENPFIDFDRDKLIATLLNGKWWILGILSVFVFAAVLFLRYTAPIYQANSSLRIELQSGTIMTELGGPGNDPSQLQSQVEVIKSRSMIEKVVMHLELYKHVYGTGRLISSELYGARIPFDITLDLDRCDIFGETYEIDFISKSKFKITNDANDGFEPVFGELNKPFKLKTTVLNITRNGATELFLANPYKFRIVKPSEEAYWIAQELKIEIAGVSTINLTYKDVVNERAKDVLNSLMKIYLQDEINLKRESTERTIDFIDTLLFSISGQMAESEQDVRGYKAESRTQYYDVAGENNQIFVTLDQQVKKHQLALSSLQELSKLLQDLRDNDRPNSQQFLPVLSAIFPSQLVELINQLNTAILDRERLLAKFPENNVLIKDKTALIKKLLASVESSLELAIREEQKLLQITLGEQRKASGKVVGVLNLQQDLEKVLRPFELYKEIYGMLLKKKTEASISLASITSSSRVVDAAQLPTVPISPKANMVLVGSMALGLLLGLGFVLVRQLMRPTLSTREELIVRTNLNLIGEIFRSPEADKDKTGRTDKALSNLNLTVFKHPNSVVTESFRSLRANILFALQYRENQAIAITSTISGEGKSHVALNLAAIFSVLGKRILLVDLDLRKPRLHGALNVSNDSGVSSYLAQRDELEDIIQTSGFENFDIITAGPIPPNPAELIASEAFQQFKATLLERYDYVFFDTSPVGLVTDSISLMRNTNLNLYLFRADYSRRSFLRNPARLVHDLNIQNLYLVLNFVAPSARGYGKRYGYGYGYGASYGAGYLVPYGAQKSLDQSNSYFQDNEAEDKKPWWKFWKH